LAGVTVGAGFTLDEIAADLAEIEEVLESPEGDAGGKWIDHGQLMNYGMTSWIASGMITGPY
jgi:hypothetical protein